MLKEQLDRVRNGYQMEGLSDMPIEVNKVMADVNSGLDELVRFKRAEFLFYIQDMSARNELFFTEDERIIFM